MTDIVERLRYYGSMDPSRRKIAFEAATEIERLRTDRELWRARASALLWYTPDDVTCRELREAVKEALAMERKNG